MLTALYSFEHNAIVNKFFGKFLLEIRERIWGIDKWWKSKGFPEKSQYLRIFIIPLAGSTAVIFLTKGASASVIYPVPAPISSTVESLFTYFLSFTRSLALFR